MVFSSVIQNVMTSIGEAEYAAAFFHTAQMAAGLRKTLSDLGYPHQPATYNLVDNEEVTILSNRSVRKVLTCNFIGYAIVQYKCKNLSLSGVKGYITWLIFSPNLLLSVKDH